MKISFRKSLLIFSAAFIAAVSSSALAQDAQTSSELPKGTSEFTYSPEGCDFQVTFPQEPYNTRRCHPDFPNQCDIMTSFTKIYNMDSSLTFYVSCNPVNAREYLQFTQDTMRTMLIARAGNRLRSKQTAYKEENGIKMSSIIGAGKSPAHRNNVILYISQIWMSEDSLMTVEGELIGQGIEEADNTFANILRSLGRSEVVTEESAEDDEEASEDEKSKEESKAKDTKSSSTND